MTSRVRCTKYKDCFANVDGKCICLTDNNFKDNKCPFYKRKTQLAVEKKHTAADSGRETNVQE
ncbi:MAG: hypothetical protein ACI38A_12065 [Candidatus Ornithomonoglobus sp.]